MHLRATLFLRRLTASNEPIDSQIAFAMMSTSEFTRPQGCLPDGARSRPQSHRIDSASAQSTLNHGNRRSTACAPPPAWLQRARLASSRIGRVHKCSLAHLALRPPKRTAYKSSLVWSFPFRTLQALACRTWSAALHVHGGHPSRGTRRPSLTWGKTWLHTCAHMPQRCVAARTFSAHRLAAGEACACVLLLATSFRLC